MSNPVTAVMITGKKPERLPLARVAVESFLRQSYITKSMLIINTSDTPVLPSPDPAIEEWICPEHAPKSLGYLRNLAFSRIKSGRIVQWDDDDFSHPERLRWQLEKTPKDVATVLRREVHCCLQSGEKVDSCGLASRVHGFAGTMMFPANTSFRFPNTPVHEDTEFLLKFKLAGRLRTIDNDAIWYVRLFHGHNTWGREHVMRSRPGNRELTPEQLQYVNWVLDFYAGLEIPPA